MNQNVRRQFAAAAIVAAGFCFLAGVYAVGLTEEDAAASDYIGYWAAGQQLVHGANPYDTETVLRMEKAVGLGNLQIKITPSPPVGLVLVLPLGFLSAKSGLVFWLLLQLVCLAIALLVVWVLAGRPPTRTHLFGFLFAPAIACMMAGQMGVLCLLGIALFLLWHERRPFVAGVALLPCCMKPHLFLPVVVCLLLWSAWRRTAWIFVGFAAAMAASYAAVVAFDRNAWTQYVEMMHSNVLQDRFAPTLSAYLRWDVARGEVWLEYLPTALACLWAGWYFWTRSEEWKWTEHGLVVLLVGVMCAPYAWITDEAVLLPAVLGGVYAAMSAKRSVIPIGVFAGVALLELLAHVPIISWYFTWTTPAWLAWYLYATGRWPSAKAAAAS